FSRTGGRDVRFRAGRAVERTLAGPGRRARLGDQRAGTEAGGRAPHPRFYLTGRNEMAWNWPWTRRPGSGEALPERKAAGLAGFIALHRQGEALWTRRDYAPLAREGFMRNPIVHRSVRMVAEAAATVPWLLYEGAAEFDTHPLLDLLARPNQRQGGAAFMETLYGHLLLSGNAYVERIEAGTGARELHLLRPDRVRVVADAAGWPVALDYGEGRAKRRVGLGADGTALQMSLFHP